jgi:hypothetical protein
VQTNSRPPKQVFQARQGGFLIGKLLLAIIAQKTAETVGASHFDIKTELSDRFRPVLLFIRGVTAETVGASHFDIRTELSDRFRPVLLFIHKRGLCLSSSLCICSYD